jgi:hypothetical protein
MCLKSNLISNGTRENERARFMSCKGSHVLLERNSCRVFMEDVVQESCFNDHAELSVARLG